MAVAVAPYAQGIRRLRPAVLAAREIMTDLPMGTTGVFTLKGPSAVDHQAPTDPNRLLTGAARPSAASRLPAAERDRILGTAITFLDTGSLVDTARRLYCHRNTIVNRLAAFERYSGLNLQRPRDLSLNLLALQEP